MKSVTFQVLCLTSLLIAAAAAAGCAPARSSAQENPAGTSPAQANAQHASMSTPF